MSRRAKNVARLKGEKLIKLTYESVTSSPDDTEQRIDRAFDVLFDSVINSQLINNNEKEKDKKYLPSM